MKELYRFKQFLTESVTADEIASRVRKLGKEKGIEDEYIEDKDERESERKRMFGDDEKPSKFKKSGEKAGFDMRGLKEVIKKTIKEYTSEYDPATAKRNAFAASYNRPGDTKRFRNYMEFLSKLRISGKTNMLGAVPYLQAEFNLEKKEAKDLLSYWMGSYRNPDLDESLNEENESSKFKKGDKVDYLGNKGEIRSLKFNVFDSSDDPQGSYIYTVAYKGKPSDSYPKGVNRVAQGVNTRNLKILSEIDMNDPVVMRSRAARDNQPEPSRGGLDFEDVMYLRDDKKDLEDRIKQLYIDMEQEAEPEGGEVADRYGSELNKLEDKLYRVMKQINDYDMNESTVTESKGAKNYFDDLKYYYTKTLPYLDKDEKEEYKQLAKDFFSKLQEATRQDLGMVSAISKSRAKAHLKNPSDDGSKVYGLDKDGKRVELKSLNDVDKFKKFEIDADLKEEEGGKLSKLNTFGELQSFIDTLKGGKQKEKLVGALDAAIGFIPGIGQVKTGIDVIRALAKKQDGETTNTFLDKMDIDDKASAIVDDKVEANFINYMSDKISGEDKDQALPSNFDMNKYFNDFLASKYDQRTIDGINESQFKDEIKRLEATVYVDTDMDGKTYIHPLDKPGVRRPSRDYIVIDGNNVVSIQGHDSGPIQDLADSYGLEVRASQLTPMGKITASGKVSLLSSNILRDAIKAIKDARDAESKRQSDYYKDRGPVSGVGNMDEVNEFDDKSIKAYGNAVKKAYGVKVGDILTKDGKKGKVVKVMDDMANVDFGNGDVYGITFSRIKGKEIVNEEAGPETVLEDATDIMLSKFPTLKAALIKLQTEDFKSFVSTIDWISPRPTEFRVNLTNGQDYILKWTGRGFEAQIMGKRYFIDKINDYQQALDKLAILYKEGPMGEPEEPVEPADTDSGGGSGGDFPGDDATGGDDAPADDAGDDTADAGGEEEGGEDLGDEPVDFEEPAEEPAA